MSFENDIFDLQTSIGSPSPSRAGFGTVMLLSLGETFSDAIRYYSSAKDANDDALLSADAKARLVTAFSQSPRPSKVAVAKRVADTIQIDTLTVLSGAVGTYTITINGTDYTHTVAVTSTATAVRDALVILVNADAELVVTAAPSSTDALTLTSDSAGEVFATITTANITVVNSTIGFGVASHIMALGDADWFGLVLSTRSDSDILRAATAIESLKRVFIGQSDSSDIITTATTDIASQIKSLSFKKSKVFYHSSDAAHGDIANMCKLLAADFDQNTPQDELLSLAGVPVDETITTTVRNNLRAKNATCYTLFKGLPATAIGQSAAGFDFELTITYLWTDARMLEAMTGLMYRLANSSRRIRFNDQGFAQLSSQAEAVLKSGEDIGHFNFTELVYKARKDVPTGDVTAQIFRFQWGAQYSGRVKEVKVTGYISTDFETLTAA